MANTPYVSLVPDAQVLAVGCPPPALVNALRKSAIEFCRRSAAYLYKAPPVSVVQGQAPYTFTLPADTEVQGYKDLKFNGNSITFIDWDFVTTLDPTWPATTIQSPPSNYTYKFITGSVYLYALPDQAYPAALLADIILCPTNTSTGLDADFIGRYRLPIISGAIRHVCQMDKQIWTDMKRALLHAKLFNQGVSDATAEVNNNFGGQQDRVIIRKWR